MFISIVLDVEYMGMPSRKMWYLKNLLHCKENGWILITHDYIRKHFDELQENVNDRFFEQFEMRKFTIDEVKDVEQYYIPDAIFEDKEKSFGSRTEMLSDLYNHNDSNLDICLNDIIEQIKIKHPNETIEGVFNMLESYESIRSFAQKLNTQLLNYSFAAFRKPHGYRQTLYQVSTNGYYWGDEDAKKHYAKFIKENADVPVFSNQELITIIGKERTLPEIKLIGAEPKYEMGVCCECFSMVPQVFETTHYTDDDIFYECKKLYSPDQFKVRSHAAHLNDIQVDRNEVHNDPASTILSSKRVTAVQSQIILKALLWKRPAIMRKEALAFSFMCSKDYTSLEIADIKALNYFIFGFLIPSELMFSDEYWKWRNTNPSETEIYKKHLTFLFNTLGIPEAILNMPANSERFRALLISRNADEQLISELVDSDIVLSVNWDVATSRFDVFTAAGKKSYWRLDTLNEDGSLTSLLDLNVAGITKVEFYPLDDVAGFASIQKVEINGEKQEFVEDFKYMAKTAGKFVFDVETSNKHLIIKCTWKYRKINEHLNSLQ